MAYYLDLFSPQTHEAFSRSDRDISGFNMSQKNLASRLKPGDKLVAYVTKVSRWTGILEVLDGPFEDSKPIFYSENDPFTCRFKVKPVVWLSIEQSIPIHEDFVWNKLSFTKKFPKTSLAWTGKVRGSLGRMDDADGAFIEQALTEQVSKRVNYRLTEEDLRKMAQTKVRVSEHKELEVSIPDEKPSDESGDAKDKKVRESIKIQAVIAEIGEKMGLKIWLPRNDRAAVLRIWKAKQDSLLEKLPLNYDSVTLATIERIDVLWIQGRAIVRAFEVEHTTSIYSGILRMADLCALQPNLDIKTYIVAPSERRGEVFQELTRPVFSLLGSKPLSEVCTFIAYDDLIELSGTKNLEYLRPEVLDEYSEQAEVY
jgi:predicted RNA-binding protein